jgi:hypothetical protein
MRAGGKELQKGAQQYSEIASIPATTYQCHPNQIRQSIGWNWWGATLTLALLTEPKELRLPRRKTINLPHNHASRSLTISHV